MSGESRPAWRHDSPLFWRERRAWPELEQLSLQRPSVGISTLATDASEVHPRRLEARTRRCAVAPGALTASAVTTRALVHRARELRSPARSRSHPLIPRRPALAGHPTHHRGGQPRYCRFTLPGVADPVPLPPSWERAPGRCVTVKPFVNRVAAAVWGRQRQGSSARLRGRQLRARVGDRLRSVIGAKAEVAHQEAIGEPRSSMIMPPCSAKCFRVCASTSKFPIVSR